MALGTGVFRTLAQAIDRECELHKKYIALLEQERKEILAAKTQNIDAVVTQRAVLCDQIQQACARRESLTSEIGGTGEPQKLSTLLETHCSPEEAKGLRPKVHLLRSLIELSRRISQDFAQVVHFSLGLVSSSLSLLWSATQEVQRAYTPQGLVREQYHSSLGRHSDLLSEA